MEIRIERDVVNAKKGKSNRTGKNFDINYQSSTSNIRKASFSSFLFHIPKEEWIGTELHSNNPIILLSTLYFQQRHNSFPNPDILLVLVFSTPHISIIESSDSVKIHGALN